MLRYVHVYNRGVDRRRIFTYDVDRRRFLHTIRVVKLKESPRLSIVIDQIRSGVYTIKEQIEFEKRFGPSIVEVIAFVLLSNHFHFLLKELVEGGISKFAQRLGNSYTRYFNTKYDRKGRLFESTYQKVEVESDEQLIHLSRYIHLNPVMARDISVDFKFLSSYPWSSYPAYLGGVSDLCNPEEIISRFGSVKDYRKFMEAELDPESVLPSRLLIDAGY